MGAVMFTGAGAGAGILASRKPLALAAPVRFFHIKIQSSHSYIKKIMRLAQKQ